MTNRELLIEFERLIQLKNPEYVLAGKLSTDVILQFINLAAHKYALLNRGYFEKTEDAARNLINLLVTQQIDLTKIERTGYTEFEAVYPQDMMYVLDEDVTIHSIEDETKVFPTEIFECTLDSYMYRITNSLTDFHYRNGYARPLRVRTTTGCRLFTDGLYDIDSYNVKYLRNVNPITIDDLSSEYTEYPLHVQKEIVDLAVLLFVQNLATQPTENK